MTLQYLELCESLWEHQRVTSGKQNENEQTNKRLSDTSTKRKSIVTNQTLEVSLIYFEKSKKRSRAASTSENDPSLQTTAKDHTEVIKWDII